MYLFEMKKKPATADKAKLEWDREWSNDRTLPRRDGDVIWMPFHGESLYFPLRGGKQFLVKPATREGVWFGGTDEEPFLVEMEVAVLDAYIKSGGSEEAFYKSLIPDEIWKLSHETSVPYKRQGDIFAARFCGEQYFEKRLESVLGVGFKEGDFRLLNTRHIGAGKGVRLTNGRVLFKGKVEAVDHAPLDLSDAIYLIGQTKYLINPTHAEDH